MAENEYEKNTQYWDLFYKKNHRHTPSQFCVCVLTEISQDAVIVELGSGNGRDSHYFSSQGHPTIAIDLSEQAIKSCENVAKSRNIQHATFYQGDLSDAALMDKVIGDARQKAENRPIVFYSRFVIHSLNAEQEAKFLSILSQQMQTNESVYFEFRSIEDFKMKKHYGNHYRRFINTSDFVHMLNSEHGYFIEYTVTGKGMAKYLEEDPFVSRVIARKI